jgi:hypothetical protein
MRAIENTIHRADVVVSFEHQADSERAISQLRRAGFRKWELGYFAWLPYGGLKNLFDRNYAPECALVGAVLGAICGVWLAPVVSGHLRSIHSVLGFVEVMALCVAGAALLFGFVGWEIGMRLHERGPEESPPVDPEAGPFIVTVIAGEDADLVWSVVRRNHGSEARHAIHAHASPI